MRTFKSVFDNYDWDTIQSRIYKTTASQVELALAKNKKNLDDFLVLISPAASIYLEQMAQECHELTKNVLGKPFKCMLRCI